MRVGRDGLRRSALVVGVASLGAIAPAEAQRRYEVEPVSQPAALTGQVRFVGAAPRPRRFFVTKDIEVCGAGYRERREVDVAEGGGLRNAVVVILGVERGKPWPDTPERHTLTQEKCVFDPHVLVIPNGAELDILNPDPVLHNIHSFEAIGDNWRTLFNFGQPPEDEVITQAIRPRRGREIRLECDAHDFMLGWIFVADSPYAVRVDDDGRFAIDGVPPGTYTVLVWHPYLGSQRTEVTLSPDERLTHEVTFPIP